MAESQDILISDPLPHVRLLTLNRPERLNALRGQLMVELAAALGAAAAEESVRAVVVTGNERAFAAGADITELNAHDLSSMITDTRMSNWLAIRSFPKPLIAAVNGFALGGGCELAMATDIIIAGADARFGQPEINLGIIPGAGGTQRLPRAIGKALAMKLALTGEMIDADTAFRTGLVAEVVPPELVVDRALELAATIAAKAPIAVRMAKAAVLEAYEGGLTAGLDYERRAFEVCFATEDKDEGTAAFIEKRPAAFKGR
ncbi:MAG: enoyl-CoA hydratase-related protein [Alphaproteobacteria bacterium]|jgi:enoyl-CoA hydratase|nr:enoyl-CoA hydratase-related protein [Alphaproteobacteria bacterium]MDP6517334.1 enoyl-CoA hydratase-related protein [Alphaproteobacteria bacterium]